MDETALRAIPAALSSEGLKTTSRIIRNAHPSNAAAIIDVHILQAGRRIRFLAPDI